MSQKRRGAERTSSKLSKRDRGFSEVVETVEVDEVLKKRNPNPLKAKTRSQEKLIQAIRSKDIIFVTGPAGSGKTYISAALAAEALDSKHIERVIATRPVVEVDNEKMGFLPGDLDEKFEPWFEPMKDVFEDRLGTSTTKYHLKRGSLNPAPLAYMRGKSYKDCWVIMDEAQNSSPEQMKMFLTRLGENCKFIIMGDVKQSDRRGQSGLVDAISKLRGVPEIGIVEFTREDIVRSGLVRKIIDIYEPEEG